MYGNQVPARGSDPYPDPIISPSLLIDRPRPISRYKSNSFGSTSSLALSMRSSGTYESNPRACSSPHLPGGVGQPFAPQLDTVPDRRSSITSQNPQISTHSHAHHSRHASVQSALSTSSHYSGDDDSDDEEISRSASPISIATTFGGAPRNNHRSRTATAERSPSPIARPLSPSSYISSTSFGHDLSRQFTIASFVAPRLSGPRMSLPPHNSRHSAITPELEEDDPLEAVSWSNGDVNTLRELAAEREIRSTPGVMGVGEGWAGGSSDKGRKRAGWFRRREKQRAVAAEDDPLALWTVPEEPRASPLKAAWNRSRSRFGASVPVLALSRSEARGDKKPSPKRAQKARSVFSLSRTDLRADSRREVDPSVGVSVVHPAALNSIDVSPPRSTYLPSISERSTKERVRSQPHLPLPRTTSLRQSAMTRTPVTLSIEQQLALSRIDTFGASTERVAPLPVTGGIKSTRPADASLGADPSSDRPVAPTPVASNTAGRNPSLRRNMITKLKSSFSLLSGGKKSGASHPTTPEKQPNSQTHDIHPKFATPPPASVSTKALPHLPSSSSARNFFKRAGSRKEPSHELEAVDESSEMGAAERKRRSFSASMLNLNRWSRSESNLLGIKKDRKGETLEDLIAKLKDIRVPGEPGAEEIDSAYGHGDRIGALAVTQRKLSGDTSNILTTPQRPFPIPLPADSSPPQLGTSSIDTSRSGSTTAHTPSFVTPPKIDVVLVPAGDEERPRPPSSQFAWASQPGKGWRRMSKVNDGAEMSITKRWLVGSRRSSVASGDLRG